MSKTKVHTVFHQDAAQGDSEKRNEPYANTVKRASQLVNTVMRRKHTQSRRLWRLAGVCDG
ncbi:hypothetical protein KC992_03610 [Candidatus Saccharibacteria bacterium]|nr:hypothetical protein [Candidatus Saccharibacteria bacterium]MCA9328938.1 hypothetical protein [Candidatus Saccharibacteria bacterium]